MRNKIASIQPEQALDRLLEALVGELLDASDDQVEQAAGDLRMDVRMKGSIAFAGLKYFAAPQAGDFFGSAPLLERPAAVESSAVAPGSGRKRPKPKPCD